MSLLRKIADLANEFQEAGMDGDVVIEVNGWVMRALRKETRRLEIPFRSVQFGTEDEDHVPAEIRVPFPFGYIVFRRAP